MNDRSRSKKAGKEDKKGSPLSIVTEGALGVYRLLEKKTSVRFLLNDKQNRADLVLFLSIMPMTR